MASGQWHEVRKLWKGFKPNQGRLRDLEGNLVSSEHRAETLAEYFEKVQWAVRPIQPTQYTDHLGPTLPLDMGTVSENEVIAAGKRLNRNKASGVENLSPEFWKAITTTGSHACQWAVRLCQKCWDEGAVPNTWHEALVISLFKKGDTANCANYHPISLLPIGSPLSLQPTILSLESAS